MITTILQGRLGNQFFELAMMLAYCKKHNLPYHIPDVAYHCNGRKMYFPHMVTGPEIQGLQEYHELATHSTPKGDGTYNYNVPAFIDIPLMDNVKFVGYWQSFKYFDSERDYILEKFKIPYIGKEMKGVVGLHVRRGDFIQLTDKHPILPLEYYRQAVKYFWDKGIQKVLVFSDDISWCRENFVNGFTDCFIEFCEGYPELYDLGILSSCEHQILCYSTFGFVAAWLNRNPDKQVIIPPKRFIFSGANADMLPNYFTELEFE